MACITTQSLPLDCLESIGGIEVIYSVELSAKASITTDASGKISAMSLNSGKQFWQYDMRKETASWATTDTPSNENGTLFFEQLLEFTAFQMTTTKRTELLLLKKQISMFIVKDKNARYWLLGEEFGMDYSAGETGTGLASGDRNGYALSFTGKERVPAKEIDSSLIAALILPAA